MTGLLPSSPPGRDYYTEFIESSRWLRKEQAEARTLWFNDLRRENKETILFRFEMLLKGLVCFGNQANHPGPPRDEEPAFDEDSSGKLEVVRSIFENLLEAGLALTGEKENSAVFTRYLESVVVQDHTRLQIAKRALDQDTPEQSLAVLLSAFKDLSVVVDALAQGCTPSPKLFSSLIKMAQREIHRSEYFDPLASFEFRMEFDRIRNVEVLEVIAGIESDPSRRVAALSFLSLFRLMRYLDLIDTERLEPRGMGPLFAFLALLRSDAGALAVFLRKDAATWMSDGFGRLYESYDPSLVMEEYDKLAIEFEGLKALRELLGSVGNQLELELRKMFEQQIHALSNNGNMEQLNRSVAGAVSSMQSFLQSAVVLVAREFRPDLEGERVFYNFSSDTARSERLRRDIWMFQQILRAFITKANGTVGATDQWAGMNSFRFVRDFVNYFKSMGYQLLRYSDYARFDKFMSTVDRLRDGDVLEVQRLSHVVSECEDFHSFLGQMFEAVSERDELIGVEFDKKDAARTLKLFLGH